MQGAGNIKLTAQRLKELFPADALDLVSETVNVNPVCRKNKGLCRKNKGLKPLVLFW
jgi:hypothetical protein